MPIEFRCHSCSKLLRTPDESAGKKAKCPQCGTIVDVPVEGAGDDGDASPTDGSDQPAPQTDATNPFAAMGSVGTGATESAGADNPYVSPKLDNSVLQADMPLVELTHNRISFDQLLNTAWAISLDNLGPMALFGVVMLAVNIALTIVNQVLSGVGNATGVVAVIIGVQFVSILLNILAQTWVGIVSILFCTRLARDRNTDLNIISTAGPYMGRGIGVTMAMAGLFLLIILFFCGVPALGTWVVTRDDDSTAIAVLIGMAVCIIPLILIMMNYILALFFVIDRRAGVFEALGLSRKYMRGNKMTAFLTLMVMQILGAIVVLCTCCLGRVLYDPFSVLVLALMYLTATGQSFEQPIKVKPQTSEA